MQVFGERIRELRLEQHLSLLELSKRIGYSDVAIGRWEKNAQIPNIDVLAAFSRYFNVSADYLLGLKDD